MRPKHLVILLLLGLAVGVGWYAGQRAGAGGESSDSSGRKVAFYQSPMHPWIKSEAPGNCTICGMKLTPVYDGEKGFEVDADMVTLSTNAINVIHVQSTAAERGVLKRTIKASGATTEDQTRRRILAAYVDGRVDELRASYPGATIKQGELLARIYSPQLLTAEREYLGLLNTNAASSALTEDRERLLDAAAQRLGRLGLSAEQIDGLRAKASTNSLTDILAPMSGTVLQRFVYEGQYVKAGDPLFELADLSEIWFEFSVYEQDLPWVDVGTPMRIAASALPGRTFESKVAFIDPNLNPATRSAQVRAIITNAVTNTRPEFLRSMFAEAEFVTALDDRLLVPRTAVLSPGNRPVVYVDLGGGNYQQRAVKLGLRGDENWEILEGVEAGELVVTTGNMLIDAQAQLNRQGESASHAHPHESPVQTNTSASRSPATIASLNAEQSAALKQLTDHAVAMAAALAADDLARFNDLAPKLSEAVAHLPHLFAEGHAGASFGRDLAALGRVKSAADLPAARAQFIPFSNRLVDLARAASRLEPFSNLKLFRCPMANEAVAAAPKNSFWLQSSGELRNPFFGSDMLTCGIEVKL